MAKIEIQNLSISNLNNDSSDSFIYELTDDATVDVYGGGVLEGLAGIFDGIGIIAGSPVFEGIAAILAVIGEFFD